MTRRTIFLAAPLICFAAPTAGATDPYFVPNRGQAPAEVRFIGGTLGPTVFLGDSFIATVVSGTEILLNFVGAREDVSVEGQASMPTRVSFIQADSSDKVLSNIETFRSVVYHGLYSGIDLECIVASGHFKTNYLVSPGADPGEIKLQYSGARSISVNSEGDLVMTTEKGVLRELAPQAYQPVGEVTTGVSASYVLGPNGDLRFSLGSYDHTRPLVIDPTIVHSSLLGGGVATIVTSVTVDRFERYYMTGWTSSPHIPARSGYQTDISGDVDAFVAEWDRLSNTFVYVTYLGGRGDDRGSGIAVDDLGNILVVGSTSSADFPRLNQQTLLLPQDRRSSAFLTKLDPTGSTVLYSMIVAPDISGATRVTVDSQSNVYIAGTTTSDSVPLVDPLQAQRAGGQDLFVVVLASNGQIKRSTYFGGSGDDELADIALDRQGSLFLTGGTTSRDFPLARPIQRANAGGQDAFVSVVNSRGSLTFSTYLGGKGDVRRGLRERGTSIAVDDDLFCYVTGDTNSVDFPTTRNARNQVAFGELGSDVFVAKIDVSAATLLYATYWGGTSDDHATGITLEKRSGGYAVHLIGYTSSEDLPLAHAIQSTLGGEYDAFAATLTASPEPEEFSSYLGGAASDVAYAAVLTGGRSGLLVAGATASGDFPLIRPASQGLSGGIRGFFTELQLQNPGDSTVIVSPSTAVLDGRTQQFQVTVSGSSDARVVWSVIPQIGTISASGLYTAPATIDTQQIVTVTATSVANPAQSGRATLTLLPARLITVVVNPTMAARTASQTQQFQAFVNGTSNTGVVWSLVPQIGTIFDSGLYVSPYILSSEQVITVTATSVVDPSKSAQAKLTLFPNARVTVSVSPQSVTLRPLAKQQFQARVNGTYYTDVIWSLSPQIVTISPLGVYTAPSTFYGPQVVTLTATSVVDSTVFTQATITLIP